jgi:hemoglobin/transferrin/lactoferrin receptor protein
MILTAAILMAALAATPADAEKTASATPGQPAAAAATAAAADQAAQADKEAKEKEAKEKVKKEKKPAPPAVHEEMVVTATRYETDSFSTPVPISVVSSETLGREQPVKMVDSLKQLPNMDVSGEGPFRGLPTIRGLNSNRVLVLVDGQRLNNARESTDFAGIQPALVDLSLVDRIEVVRGPSSVLYGSDAIGGVINIITKQQAFHQGGLTLGGSANYQYGTAANSQRGQFNLNGAGERTTFHVGVSAFEAKNYETPDGVMPNSGMRQASLDGDLRLLVTDTGVLRFNVQTTQTRDIGFPGYDPETSGIDISFPTFNRTKVSTGYDTGPFGGLNGLSLTGYYQDVLKESKRNFSFGPTFFQNNFTTSHILSWGLNAQSSADLGTAHHITFGLDFYQDNLHDQTTKSPPFPPSNNVAVPDSYQRGVGVFAQDTITVTPRLELVIGARGDNYAFVSQDDPHYTGEQFDVSQTAPAGDVSALYKVTNNVALTATVGRGFRAPNIQERSFVGLATQPDTFILQNPDLQPETSMNYELGFKYRYARYSGGLNVFRNNVHNFISLAFLGPDPENPRLQLAQFQNIASGAIQGAEFQLETYLSDRWTVFGSVSYLKGTDENTNEPLPLISPLKGVVGVRYQRSRWWGEFATRMVAHQDQVPPGYDPSPGFAVLNLLGGYEFANGLSLQVAAQNIGNVAYHEPFNEQLEPGRDFRLAVGYKF